MRKVLIATIVAMVLFAVGAFAASLTVTSENIASGDDAIEVCGNAEIDFTTTFDDAANDWRVDGVNVEFSAAACNGYGVSVAIHTATTSTTCTNTDEVASQAWTCGITPAGSGPLVEAVTSASVMVDGELLTLFTADEAHN